MRDDDAFEFDANHRGRSQFPAVLMALVAIAAILIVNLTALAPSASASAPAPATRSAGFRLMPALLREAKQHVTDGGERECTATRNDSVATLRM
jgi:hypothetical protein